MRLRFLSVAFVAMFSLVSIDAQATPLFTDWTFFNTGGSVATGTLNGISVSLTGGNLWGVTDGSSSVFSNAAVFSPALVATDYIELIGAFPTTPSYGVTFGSPVTNPIVL